MPGDKFMHAGLQEGVPIFLREDVAFTGAVGVEDSPHHEYLPPAKSLVEVAVHGESLACGSVRVGRPHR